MSLYAALYGEHNLPATLKCACGRRFHPERDRETYCSRECARQDSMRGLLGNDTLYKQNALQQQTQSHTALAERRAKKVTRIPAELSINQTPDEKAPPPLPKSARHLPQNRKPVAEKPPPLPLQLAETNTQQWRREAAPTPPPKSARHLRRERKPPKEDSRVPSIPRHPTAFEVNPKYGPAFFSQVNSQEDTSLPRDIHAQRTHMNSTEPQQTKTKAYPTRAGTYRGDRPEPQYETVRAKPFHPNLSRRPTYDSPSREAPRRPDVRRSTSMPFLQRPLAPASKLGASYRNLQATVLQARSPPRWKPTMPTSPPPAYTPGPNFAQALGLPQTRSAQSESLNHRPAPIQTTGLPFLERSVKQTKTSARVRPNLVVQIPGREFKHRQAVQGTYIDGTTHRRR